MQGWEGVRAVGEFRILTRASYSTLVIVPLLAALWPAVRVVIATYDESRHTTADSLRRGADEFQASVAQTADSLNQLAGSAPVVAEELQRISNMLQSAGARFAQQTREAANTLRSRPSPGTAFPMTLAAAFYAALFISIAHFIYQVKAPEEIRDANRADYVKASIRAFHKHPSQIAFERAVVSLGVTTFPDLPSIDSTASTQLRPHIDWIRQSAEARYRELTGVNPAWCGIAWAFYAAGLVLILLILAGQAGAILRETIPFPVDSTADYWR
jgi:hypothetical protein